MRSEPQKSRKVSGLVTEIPMAEMLLPLHGDNKKSQSLHIVQRFL